MAGPATDADLVQRFLAGDQAALATIYDRYGDNVYDLCFAMLSSGDDAADAYQDTFLTAAQKLGSLRDPSRLRPWLYSVARNQCRARLRARRRSTPDQDAGIDVGVDVDMTAELARAELRELMAEASAGLTDRDREVLELHMRHGLEGDDLADALGVSLQNAYKLVQRVRDRVERSLGALLVARHARRDCRDLDALLTDWDGTFTPLARKRISRHVDDCETCDRRRKALLDPGGLASAAPLVAAPATLGARVRAALVTPAAPSHRIRRWRADGFPASPRRGPKAIVATTLLAVLFGGGVAGGLAIAELTDDEDPVVATVETTTTTAPTPTTSSAVTTLAPTATVPTTTPPTTTTTMPADTEPPRIIRSSAGPDEVAESGPGNCNNTVATVVVSASDDVAVSSVTVRWTEPTSDTSEEVAATRVNETSWRATISFPEGTVDTASIPIELRTWATDDAGNRSDVAVVTTIRLSPCP